MKLAQIILDHPVFKGIMIDFFRNYLPEYEFDFYVIDKSEKPILNGYLSDPKENVVFRRTVSKREEWEFISDILDRYDRVIFHSLMLSPQVKAKILLHKPANIQKIVWLEWGYDLYITRPNSAINLVRYAAKMVMRKFFDRRVPFFIAIHPSDIEEYKRIVKGKGYIDWVPYRESPNPPVPPPRSPHIRMQDKRKDGQPIMIQVGHRAWNNLHHAKWLRRLAVYKDENIQVLLPLSYGDAVYADRIQAEAAGLFGSKAIVLRDVMPFEDYWALLAKVDIFILDSRRQIALGNIHNFLENQKKIYMPANGSLYRYFQSQGVELGDIEDVGKISFSVFTSEFDMTQAMKFMDRYETFDNIARWREILDQITGNNYE